METKIFDNHSHCEFSPDGRMTLEEALSAAEKMSLAGISITDHYDPECPGGTKVFSFNPLERAEVLLPLRQKYEGRLAVMDGIEMGMQPHAIGQAREIISAYPYDVVIASLHFIDGIDPYYGEYYKGLDRKTAYGRYFETMHECIKALEDFDVLGHFDYIARYAPYPDYSIRYSDFPDHFDEIFRYLIHNGKVLEINTNTYRLRNGRQPVLDQNILIRYRELGGEAVSLGSDAHESVRVGESLKEYAEGIIRASGIRYTAYFCGRKMVCSSKLP